MKRPMDLGCEQPVSKLPSVCTGDLDDATTNRNRYGAMTRTRTDRGKKHFFEKHRHLLPEGVSTMMALLSCHQRGKCINNVVQKDPGGEWRFDLSQKFVQDLLCATVVYQRFTI